MCEIHTILKSLNYLNHLDTHTHSDTVHTGQYKESIKKEIVYTATVQNFIKIVTTK